MKKTTTIVCACLAGALFAADDAALSVLDGTGTVTGSGTLARDGTVELSNLILRSDTGGVVFTGGGFSFTNEASAISLQTFPPAVFEVPVSAAGDLGIKIDDSLAEIWENGFLSTSSTSPTTLFKDFELVDYIPVTGLGAGKSALNLPMAAFHVRRGEGWLTAQMQGRDTQWCKCVLIRLEQRGANVVGWITAAKYLPVAQYGADFSTQGSSLSAVMSDSLDGYGLKRLALVKGTETVGAVTMKKPLRTAGTLSVDSQIAFTADGPYVLAANGLVTNGLEIAGSFTITNTPNTVYSNVLSGAGGSLTFGGYATRMTEGRYECTFPVAAPSGAWQVAAANATLACLTNVEITAYAGGAITAKPNPDGKTFHLKTSGATMVCQCQQVDGGWIKCPRLQFRQNGANVEVKLLDAWYTALSSGRGVDFDTLPSGTAAKGSSRVTAPVRDPVTIMAWAGSCSTSVWNRPMRR